MISLREGILFTCLRKAAQAAASSHRLCCARTELALRDRFDRAIEAGELPLTVSAPDLARFYSVIIQGIALQAQHGGTQEQLFGVVDMVMESWPVRSRKRR